MFDNLTERLSAAARSLSGRGRLTDDNIKDSLREIRLALLEADVALPVVKSFIAQVRDRAVGEEISRSLSPGQALVRIIHAELVALLGAETAELNLRAQPPVVVLLAGLQGAGKTTTAGKLALRLREKQGKKVMLVSVDVHRPAAILQLETLARTTEVLYHHSEAGEDPADIARRAIDDARRQHADVLIIDSAGRLHVDDAMMNEIRRVQDVANPTETLFVVDSMAGQDAVNSARAFGETLSLTGVILTKADGDSRGGVALSAAQVTGCPVRFLGVGEKSDALEVFHPERMASRILGMGDLQSLVEDLESRVDQDKARELARKVKRGGGFDLGDLRDQLLQMMNMGGMAAMLEKLPLPGGVSTAALRDPANDRHMRRQVALINSMTPAERRFPKTINGSRKRRIARGAGLEIQDVNRLLKQHRQMEKMMRKASKGGMQRMLQGLGGGQGPAGRPRRFR